MISNFDSVPSKPKWHSFFTVGVFVLALILASTRLVPLKSAIRIATVALIVSGTISTENIINSIDWKVLLIIASSFGIAVAVEKSGVGTFFTNIILSTFSNFGIMGTIIGIYTITAVYTNFMTNNTAAALMFPIG